MASMLSLMIIHQPAFAATALENSSTIPNAAKKLVQFCADSRTGLDKHAVATLVDFVLGNKTDKEISLPQMEDSPGAYYEFDTKIPFSRFMSYCYGSQIPAVLTRPSSMRYSMWTSIQGKSLQMLDKLKLAAPGNEPLIIHGLQRDCNTPDVTTGVYYEYDLKRTLIHLNYKGRRVLISVSKQVRQSDIGKKGLILGNDEDWNYYYSGEAGSFKTGIGWVKSYIYDYFSLGVYAETGASSNLVRSGTFQWIRAGWSGMNFVQTSHILNGLKRFARNSKSVLESPKLPSTSQIGKNYQMLSALPSRDLFERYAALRQAQQSLAVQTGKLSSSDIKRQEAYDNIPKDQIIQELMLEYLKVALGKPSLLGKKSFWF